MSKGIIYVMSTVVDGLVKIGKTKDYESRMRFLEKNGYFNVVGLKREFAIEVDNYADKEELLHNIFSKSRVSTSELFSIDINLVKQLMSSFDGKIIYPKDENRNLIFNYATEAVEIKNGIVPDGEYTLKIKIRGIQDYSQAVMKIEQGKIFVEKGAKLAPIGNISEKGWLEKRKSIKTINNFTVERIECDSFSMAAAIVCGHNQNGWKSWKNSKGQYIDVYRNKEIK